MFPSSQAADSGQFKTVVIFECRGLEPIDFDPRVNFLLCRVVWGSSYALPLFVQVGYCAVGEESGTRFTDVDLSEKVYTIPL